MITRDNPAQFLGWKRSLPDFRDQKFSFSKFCTDVPVDIPPKADLSPLLPEPYQQLSLGSCTGNAIAGAIELDQVKQGLERFTPSRLFIYYCEREEEGTTGVDCGATLRDGMKVINIFGAPPEAVWPYDIGQFAIKPSEEAYLKAADHQAIQYAKVNQEINEFKRVIAGGFPIIFGFTVYDYFLSSEIASTGILKMPASGEGVQGGHAVLAVGYDDETQMLKVRNSWGKQWGQDGYFQMPYAYMTSPSLADDFWSLQLIEGQAPHSNGSSAEPPCVHEDVRSTI